MAQNRQLWFDDLYLKITVTVSWFESKNQTSYGLSVPPQNRWEGDNVGHASRSSGLLCVKVSRTKVSQSGLKTGGGATTGDACGIITEVASRSSQR
jgi:hypothetical protein